VKHYGLDADARISVYRPYTQSGARTMFVALRTTVPPESLVAAVRGAIGDLDPDLPVASVMTMTGRLDRSLAQREFAMLLFATFSALALVLATIGVYGVMSYLVTQGRRELGIRLALGATPWAVIRLVLGQGLVVALAGVSIGLVAALALTRLFGSLLFGVAPTDPVTFAGVAGLLLAVALVACYIPARRAGRIDPMRTLRSE
jgi:ABC-type antimicrobial peptide transport system permease subunit